MNKAVQALVGIGLIKFISHGVELVSISPLVPLSFTRGWGWIDAEILGWFCLATALFIFLAWLSQRPRFLSTACLVGFAVYFMITASSIDDTGFVPRYFNWHVFFENAFSTAFWLILGLVISFRHGVHEILVRRRKEESLGGVGRDS